MESSQDCSFPVALVLVLFFLFVKYRHTAKQFTL